MAQDNNRNIKKTIAGKVEKIVFHSQNNGRTILSVLRDDGKTCRVLGTIAEVEINSTITAIGLWQKDEKYGWQFVAETIQQDSHDNEDEEPTDDGLIHALDYSNVLIKKRKDFRDAYQANNYDEEELVVCDYDYGYDSDNDSLKKSAGRIDRININGAIYNKNMTTLISGPDQSSFIIPDSVTCIGDNAFSGCKNLTSIIIPNSVTSIGAEAFSCCHALASIEISRSIQRIGDNAFHCCFSLAVISISEIIESKKILIEIPEKQRIMSPEDWGKWIIDFIQKSKMKGSECLRFLIENHVSDQYTVIPIVEYVGGYKRHSALFTEMLSGLPHIVWENLNDEQATYVFQSKENNYERMRNVIIDFLYSDMDNKRRYLLTNNCRTVFGEKPYVISHSYFDLWKLRLTRILRQDEITK